MATKILSQSIPRDELAAAFKSPRLIKAIENLATDVSQNIPENLDGNTEAVEKAQATANDAEAKAVAAQEAAEAFRELPLVVAVSSSSLPNSRLLSVTTGLDLDDAAGVLTLSPADLLAALQALAATGFIARTGADQVAVRTIAAGSVRVQVTDGAGVAGNPLIDVKEDQLNLLNMIGSTRLFKTGDFKRRVGQSFGPGWIRSTGGTIGNTGSGATNFADPTTQPLYTLWWTEFNDTQLPIQTNTGAASTRGASATADFNAGKRLSVPSVADDGLLIGGFRL